MSGIISHTGFVLQKYATCGTWHSWLVRLCDSVYMRGHRSVYCANSTFYCYFHWWGTCGTTPKTQCTHAQLCSNDFVRTLHCFDKLKPNCSPNANLKPNLKLNILFLWLSSIYSEIWSYNSVGPKFRRWLEQNLHVITPVHGWESIAFFTLIGCFTTFCFFSCLCFFLLDHDGNLLWNYNKIS